ARSAVSSSTPASSTTSATKAPTHASSPTRTATARTCAHHDGSSTAAGGATIRVDATGRAGAGVRAGAVAPARTGSGSFVAGCCSSRITTRAAIARVAPTPTRPMTNVNTPTSMVSGRLSEPSDATTRHPGRWLRRWWWLVVAVSVTSVLTTVFVVSLLLHVPYVIEGPGSVEPVQPLVSVPAGHDFPTEDRINLVTVTVDTDVTLFEKVVADCSSDNHVVPAQEVLAGQTREENDRLNEV